MQREEYLAIPLRQEAQHLITVLPPSYTITIRVNGKLYILYLSYPTNKIIETLLSLESHEKSMIMMNYYEKALESIDKIIKMIEKGLSPQQISRKLSIPLFIIDKIYKKLKKQ